MYLKRVTFPFQTIRRHVLCSTAAKDALLAISPPYFVRKVTLSVSLISLQKTRFHDIFYKACIMSSPMQQNLFAESLVHLCGCDTQHKFFATVKPTRCTILRVY